MFAFIHETIYHVVPEIESCLMLLGAVVPLSPLQWVSVNIQSKQQLDKADLCEK